MSKVSTRLNSDETPRLMNFPTEEHEEFLAALKQRAASRRELPATSIATIENSEHKHVIFNCLANNWSAARVHIYLMQTAHVDIPISTIQAFKDELNEDDFLPITHLQRRFRDLDIEVDAIGELARLLRLKAERLDAALFLESVTHPLHTIVDQQLHEYWDLLKQYLAIQKGLGFFAVDTVSNVLPAGVLPGEIASIRQLVEMKFTSQNVEHNTEDDVIDVTATELT